MRGLPLHPGQTGWAIWIIGLLLGTVYAFMVRRRVVASARDSLAVASIVLLLIATGLGSAPFVTWRFVTDIRQTSKIDAWLLPRYGVSEHGLHPELFDNAAALIPEGDRYYLAPSPELPSAMRSAFVEWSLGYLLPRIAVSDPEDADWILTLGVDPETVGPELSQVWVVKEALGDAPAASLGKVS